MLACYRGVNRLCNLEFTSPQYFLKRFNQETSNYLFINFWSDLTASLSQTITFVITPKQTII